MAVLKGQKSKETTKGLKSKAWKTQTKKVGKKKKVILPREGATQHNTSTKCKRFYQAQTVKWACLKIKDKPQARQLGDISDWTVVCVCCDSGSVLRREFGETISLGQSVGR